MSKAVKVEVFFKNGASCNLETSQDKALSMVVAFRKFIQTGAQSYNRFILSTGTEFNTVLFDFENVIAIVAKD